MAPIWLLLALLARDVTTIDPLTTQVLTSTQPAGPEGRIRIPAGGKVTVFERPGAGVIREFSLSPPLGLDATASEALRVVMSWDGSAAPAVDVPARDLFGAVPGAMWPYTNDFGCVTDQAWTLSLPMPFGRGAKVELVNDSPMDVETRVRCRIDPLDIPPVGQGRLHVDHRRVAQELPGEVTLLAVKEAAGHLVGVRLDVLANTPAAMNLPLRAALDTGSAAPLALSLRELFRESEPAQLPDAGLLVDDRPEWRYHRAGYRSFCAAPVRFRNACRLTLDGSQAAPAGEADLDTTVFWYAAQPYADRPMVLPFGQRRQPYLGIKPPPLPRVADFQEFLKADPNPDLRFDSAADLKRIAVAGHAWPTYPRWVGQPQAKVGNSHPGRQGMVVIMPRSADDICRLAWKVRVPEGGRRLYYSVSPDPYDSPQLTNVQVHFYVYDGQSERKLRDLQLTVKGDPTPDGWREDAVPLGDVAGKEVVIVVEVTPGGPKSGFVNDKLFINRLAIVGDRSTGKD